MRYWALILCLFSLTSCGTSPERRKANQFSAATNCKAYAESQEAYYRTDHDKDGVFEYAKSISELFELTGDGYGFLDKGFAHADATLAQPAPKNGYIFKILTAQGSAAGGGKKSYIDEKGNMTGGYALVAYPSNYGNSGTLTFIICRAGTYYQADLGPKSAAIAQQMTEFDPVKGTWKPSEY